MNRPSRCVVSKCSTVTRQASRAFRVEWLQLLHRALGEGDGTVMRRPTVGRRRDRPQRHLRAAQSRLARVARSTSAQQHSRKGAQSAIAKRKPKAQPQQACALGCRSVVCLAVAWLGRLTDEQLPQWRPHECEHLRAVDSSSGPAAMQAAACALRRTGKR